MIFFNAHTHFSVHPSSEILQVGLDQATSNFHSVGIHPWESASYSDLSVEKIIEKCANPNCIAIGEIGLDGLKGPEMSLQRDVFIDQVLIAEKLELPVIIHCVKAWNEIREIKKKLKPKQIWMSHGFAQSNIVQEVVRENFMISLGAHILKHPKKEVIVEAIPLNQLLLETDDIEIDIREIYQCVADLKKIPLHELAQIIEFNLKNTFPKWHPK